MNTPILDIGTFTEPLLIFGGPYSNLAATQAMRAEAERLMIPPQRVICTGDLVAYCARPQETVDLIRDWGIHVVLGNCEESLAAGAIDCGCGFKTGTACSLLSVEWYNYAAQHIDEAARIWFATLPRTLKLNFRNHHVQVVHGTPTRINQFIFASTDQNEKLQELKLLECDTLIAGHCGIPFGESIGNKYWLNAGVIGMPANDGTPDGWYMLLEGSNGSCRASWQRLSYHAAQTATEMQNAGLKSGYAETILNGLWPSEDVLPNQDKKQRGKALQPAPLRF
jgi:predicted phosphodiesterase